MAGWHHQLEGREFEQAPGVGDGQGGLVCGSPRDHRVRHGWAAELAEGMRGRPCVAERGWAQVWRHENREVQGLSLVYCLRVKWEWALVRFKAEKMSSEWIIKSLVHCAKELGFYPEGTGNEVRVSDKTEWNLHLERHLGRNMRADWQYLLQRWSLIHSCLMTLMFRSVNFT